MKRTLILLAMACAAGVAGAATPEEKAAEKAVMDVWERYDDAAFLEKYAEAERKFPDYVANSEYFKARFNVHRRALEAAKSFPLAEKDLKFGQTLKSMGVAERKTVHLKDYWNPTNVTAAFQRLIDDPEVTTIVVDAMPTPWYVASVKFGEKVCGKRVLVKGGAKILKGDEFLRYRQKKGRGPGPMFVFESCENVIFESDAVKPEDVLVGCYATYAERLRLTKEYGQSVFQVTHKRGRRVTRNIVLRNLYVANSEEDGLCTGANWNPPEEIYVENVVFDGHFRQATSPCTYYSLYFKDCKFLNTRGAPPGAGVDVEPWTDNLADAILYFFDCEFANNAGGALGFATSTRDPILCCVKRCRFRPTAGEQFFVCARPTNYMKADGKPISKIVLEDCEFDSKGPTFGFEPCPIYDVTVRNCVIRDARSAAVKARAAKGPAVIRLALNRDFGKPDLSPNLKPKVTFENVKIVGFEDSDPLGVADETGKLNISGVFFGTVDWNGRPFDLSQVSYAAPDLHEPKTRAVPSAKLQKPAKVAADGEAMPESNARLCFNGAWWLKHPCQSYYFYAEKGRTVTFDFRMKFPAYYKRFPTNEVFMTSAEGREVKLGDVTKGTVTLSYVAPDTGWHRFSPGVGIEKDNTIASGQEWYVTNVKGSFCAYQADTESDCFAKFFLADDKKPYTGYFEVPAGGKPCRLRINYGGFEIRDPAGNLVDTAMAGTYAGRKVVTLVPSSDKAEIWSFTTPCTPEGGWTRGLRFYAPLNGIWADSPDFLPCEYAEHFGGAGRAALPVGRTDPVRRPSVKLDVTKLSAADRATLESAKAARKAFAAKGEYAALKSRLDAQVAKMRAGTMDDDAQHQIADITEQIVLHGRVAAMEKKAAAEPDGVFEVASFCQAFMSRLVTDVAPDSPVFAVRLEEELSAYGLAAPEGVLEYDDPSALMPLVDALMLQLKAR